MGAQWVLWKLLKIISLIKIISFRKKEKEKKKNENINKIKKAHWQQFSLEKPAILTLKITAHWHRQKMKKVIGIDIWCNRKKQEWDREAKKEGNFLEIR